MGEFLAFTVKGAVVLTFLFAVYKLSIGRVKSIAARRFSLLLIYFSALLLPSISFIEVSFSDFGKPQETEAPVNVVYDNVILDYATFENNVEPSGADIIISVFAMAIVLGVLINLALTLAGFIKIGLCRRRSRIVEMDGGETIAVVSHPRITPFSFGKTIFLSEKDYTDMDGMVLAHESSHIRHRHYLDLLFGRVTTCLMWWNPITWLMLRELHDVHEFQADGDVVADGYDMKSYQYLLIKKAAGSRLQTFADSLNHSKLKKRLTMMKKSEKKDGKRLVLLMLPAILAGSVILSTDSVASMLEPLGSVDDFLEEIMPDHSIKNRSETEGKDNENKPELQIVAHGSSVVAGGTEDIYEEVKDADQQPGNSERKLLNVETVKNDTLVIKKVFNHNEPYKRPAISINGVVQDSDFVLESINPSSIKAISVFKDKPEYPDGLVEIYLNDDVDQGNEASAYNKSSEPIRVVGYAAVRKDNTESDRDPNCQEKSTPVINLKGNSSYILKELNNIKGTHAKILIIPADNKEVDIKKAQFFIAEKLYDAETISSSFSKTEGENTTISNQRVEISLKKSHKHFGNDDKVILTTSNGKVELKLH